MAEEHLNKDEIFNAAADMADQDEQVAFLDQVCGDDAELKAEIVDLLRLDREQDSLLDRTALGLLATDLRPLAESPGDMIGPYKLLQQIGEGGMGVVWMAEQQQPVRRRVALKVIKPGMDSRQVLARFEAERQALAMMDHQNIAKVLAAGATETGRPFFVMELITGVPITTFCEKNRCTVRERLELFIPVCKAIQHAHQKGIIHRDIKPTNVLVTMYDDMPVPKVIDFGIAKALDQRLTERTLFTQFGMIVGTLEYMSPEQAEMNALGIDTRSDVYSLGALMYELLTGTTPLDRSQLCDHAWQDLLKKIKEEDPLRPSLRLSTSGSLTQFAQICRATPATLPQMLSRELDWIVMKCLEKNRSRRYETASGLARDLERYLADEPVEACPPTFLYRVQKVTHRHRLALSIAASFATILMVGILVSVSLATWAWRSRQEALQSRAAAEVALAKETAAREEAQLARQKAESLVRRLSEATQLVNEGISSESQGMFAEAHDKYSQAIASEPNYREAYVKRGELYATFGLWDRMAADFGKRFQLANRADPVTHLEHALLRAYVNDERGYQSACVNFLENMKGSPHTAHHQLLVRAVAVAHTPIIENNQLVGLADRALERNRHPYDVYVSGLAHLRAGLLEEALQRFHESLQGAENSPEPIHRSGYAPLALALHQLGRGAEAEQALIRAHQTLDETIASIIESGNNTSQMPKTHDWLEFWLYLREAERVIKQRPLTQDARLVQRGRTAWAMLTEASPESEDAQP